MDLRLVIISVTCDNRSDIPRVAINASIHRIGKRILIVTNHVNLLGPLKLLCNFESCKPLFLQPFFVVLKYSLALIAAPFPIAPDTIFHLRCNAQDTGVDVKDSIFHWIFDYYFGKIPKFSFAHSSIRSGFGYYTNDNRPIFVSKVVHAKNFAPPNFHQSVTSCYDQAFFFVGNEARSNGGNLSASLTPQSHNNDSSQPIMIYTTIVIVLILKLRTVILVVKEITRANEADINIMSMVASYHGSTIIDCPRDRLPRPALGVTNVL
mmetsp:Transcript_87719/g.178905  ORF Transcript_87719/g.178905 Transcript_87719/m.178905 type:complete len:265 (-) Transcript_87719:1206-2000(-)